MSNKPSGTSESDLPPFPFGESLWHRTAEILKFSPQQKRVAELILRQQQDEEIAAIMGLAVPTVRTHLREIFKSKGTKNRLALVLLIFTIVLQLLDEDDHQN